MPYSELYDKKLEQDLRSLLSNIKPDYPVQIFLQDARYQLVALNTFESDVVSQILEWAESVLDIIQVSFSANQVNFEYANKRIKSSVSVTAVESVTAALIEDRLFGSDKLKDLGVYGNDYHKVIFNLIWPALPDDLTDHSLVYFIEAHKLKLKVLKKATELPPGEKRITEIIKNVIDSHYCRNPDWLKVFLTEYGKQKQEEGKRSWITSDKKDALFRKSVLNSLDFKEMETIKKNEAANSTYKSWMKWYDVEESKYEKNNS